MLLLLNTIRKERLGGDASPTFGQWGQNAGHGKKNIHINSHLSIDFVVPGYQPVDGSSTPSNNP